MELVILGWALVFAVVVAAVFVAARVIVQIATVAYEAMEQRRSASSAAKEGAVLGVGALVALIAAALVFATALLAVLAMLLQGNTF